jgi:putative transcription factor
MCGQESKTLKKAIIEYSVLRVCPSCAKFGKIVPDKPAFAEKKPAPAASPSAAPVSTRKKPVKDVFESSGRKELAIDYSTRVKKARLAKGWTPEELGKVINEKKSLITKLETGEMKPNEKLIRKLEKTLNIRLMEELEDVKVGKKKAQPTVLGDIVKIK